MKTLSEILKEIFALRDRTKSKPSKRVAAADKADIGPPEQQEASESQKLIINPKNSERDERETDENRGDNHLDTPADTEAGKSHQGESASQTQDQGETKGEASGDAGQQPGRECIAETGEPGNGIRGNDPLPDGIETAYAKGYKDGRNATIEERYFPKTDDGIPVFRGKPEKRNLNPDIFSMAREA